MLRSFPNWSNPNRVCSYIHFGLRYSFYKSHLWWYTSYWEFNLIGGPLSEKYSKFSSENSLILELWSSVGKYTKNHQIYMIFLEISWFSWIFLENLGNPLEFSWFFIEKSGRFLNFQWFFRKFPENYRIFCKKTK